MPNVKLFTPIHQTPAQMVIQALNANLMVHGDEHVQGACTAFHKGVYTFLSPQDAFFVLPPALEAIINGTMTYSGEFKNFLTEDKLNPSLISTATGPNGAPIPMATVILQDPTLICHNFDNQIIPFHEYAELLLAHKYISLQDPQQRRVYELATGKTTHFSLPYV